MKTRVTFYRYLRIGMMLGFLLGATGLAAAEQKYYQLRLVNEAEKSTRISALSCNAPYIGDVQVNGESLAAFVTVPGCASASMGPQGWEFRERRIVSCLPYFLLTKNPE